MRIQWSQFQALNPNNLDEVPSRAGVYLLWTKLTGRNWRIFYVGQAEELQPVLRRHMAPTEPNPEIRRRVKCGVTGFEYSVQPDTELRHGVSKFLAQYYEPECGAAPVPEDVGEIQVNLPGAV